MTDGLLLTGATGFVGAEVLHRFLCRTERTIYLPVRAADEAQASERVDSTLESLFGTPRAYRDRVVAIASDITQPALGLDEQRREWLAERVTDIVHSAASVSFSLPLDESRQINVVGTEQMLDFAELCRDRGGLGRFSYVSTAYVAGTHAGVFGEDQLSVGQGFRNAYEQSKHEAETGVWERSDRLPVQVFRPSIVVGDRASGWTQTFNVLYWPIRAFSLGAYKALPARRSAPVDVVPVDYVADAIFELSNRPKDVGVCYHLTAAGTATTVGKLMEMTAKHFDRPVPRVIPPALYWRIVHPILLRVTQGTQKKALAKSEVYFPYFSMEVRYDNSRARGALEPEQIKMSPIEDFYDRLIEFALATRFGKTPVSRAEAFERAPSELPQRQPAIA